MMTETRPEEEPKASSEKKAGMIEMLGKGKADIEINGEKYSCRAPEIGDTAQFAITMREELMDSVYKQAEKVLDTLTEKGLSEEICATKYMSIIEKGGIDEFKLLGMLGSLRGTQFLFLSCAIDNHPELTEKAVKKLVTSANWRQIRHRLNILKGPILKNAPSGEVKSPSTGA
jgi:hypothetical protein